MQPTQLGPYRIRSRLGRGGMGAVYEAEDPAGGLVAVKTLASHLGDDAGLRRRFTAEIEALKALRHPGIVRLLAYGEDQGTPFFAMELVAGKSLEQALQAGRVFSWRETVSLALEIVRALKSAHDHGVVHRDLKPANLLLLDAPAAGPRVKLADFGIARLFGDAGQTLAGTVVGTAEYMAPEQAAGLAVDHRADLYALGLVMFAMLAGRPPFRDGDVVRLLERQRREPAPRVAERVPDVPAELDDLIAGLLAKDPARRPPNALAVGRMLATIEALPDVAAATRRADPRAATHPAGRGEAVDRLAPTSAMPGMETAAAPAAATGLGAGEASPQACTAAPGPTEWARAATVPVQVTEPPAAGGHNRFTTMEDLHRAAEQGARADRRRHRTWQGLAATATLAAVIAVGYAVGRSRTADEVFERIQSLAADDLRDARPLIDEFLARHPADPRAAAVGDLARRLDLDDLERRARRRPRSDRAMPPIERDYRAAMAREADGPAACVAGLEALLAVHDATATAAGPGADATALWLALVRRQLDRLGPAAAREREEDARRARAVLAEAADLAGAAAAAAAGRRDDLATRRRTLLQGLVELHAARPHMATIVAEARQLLGADTPPAPAEPRP